MAGQISARMAALRALINQAWPELVVIKEHAIHTVLGTLVDEEDHLVSDEFPMAVIDRTELLVDGGAQVPVGWRGEVHVYYLTKAPDAENPVDEVTDSLEELALLLNGPPWQQGFWPKSLHAEGENPGMSIEGVFGGYLQIEVAV